MHIFHKEGLLGKVIIKGTLLVEVFLFENHFEISIERILFGTIEERQLAYP
jgi:hypothetical protein